MTEKEKLIQRFEQLRKYYGKKLSHLELRAKLTKNIRPEYEKKSLFDKCLKDYITTIRKLNTWNS
jgi:hypothetical protein